MKFGHIVSGISGDGAVWNRACKKAGRARTRPSDETMGYGLEHNRNGALNIVLGMNLVEHCLRHLVVER